jgi:hypothetical protein
MELTHKNIEEYITRFMEGETTNAEEKALYHYFRTADVPEHLKPYATMFAWYEEGMPDAPKAQKKPLWRYIPVKIWSAGIAAMLVIGLGVGIFSSLDLNKDEEWVCYEGSYVKVNGQLITDVKKILPIILQTQADGEKIERDLERQLAEIQSIEAEAEEKEAMLENF